MTGVRATGVVALAIVLIAAACSSSSSSSSPTSANAKPTTTVSDAATTTTVPTTPPVATACTARPHASGEFSQSFQFESEARTYQLYVPPSYRGTKAVPLVFNFHGYGSNAAQQMVYGNFKPEADRFGFVIVAPDGQDTGKKRHYNLTGEKNLQNDITMVIALLDRIEATFCIDTNRVYSTGMSDGGGMTSVLACLAPNRFAAFGPVAVQVYVPGCAGTRPVAMVAFHGTADPLVPYNGKKGGGFGFLPVPGTMAQWATHDHCNATFTDTSLGTQVDRRVWTGCSGTSSIVLYSIVGGGHTWPDSIPIPSFGLTTKQIDASATIWAFFAAHPLAG